MSRFRSVSRSLAEHVLVRIPPRRRRGARLILAYHNVVASESEIRGDRSLHLPLEHFTQQLDVIRAEAAVVPLLDLLLGAATTYPRVALTFDDAYRSALQHGVSTCSASGVPSTIFVSPSLLGTIPEWDRRADRGTWSAAERHAFLWQSRGMGTHEPVSTVNRGMADAASIAPLALLQQIAAMPHVTLGNHTMHHANLGALDAAEVESEIRECEEWLGGLQGVHTLPVVAFPYGSAPRSPIGERFGLLVTGGWFDAPPPQHRVPRWNVPSGVSVSGFRARLRGWLI